MAQLPGYLRPSTPAASSRPGSLLDIVGALGPRHPAPRASAARDRLPAHRERATVPVAMVAAAASARRGVGAPGHG